MLVEKCACMYFCLHSTPCTHSHWWEFAHPLPPLFSLTALPPLTHICGYSHTHFLHSLYAFHSLHSLSHSLTHSTHSLTPILFPLCSHHLCPSDLFCLNSALTRPLIIREHSFYVHSLTPLTPSTHSLHPFQSRFLRHFHPSPTHSFSQPHRVVGMLGRGSGGV